MVICAVAIELQEVRLSVNVNVAVPGLRPVTIPVLVTEAIEGLLLVHVPPDVGLNVVVAPTQIVVFPETFIVGLGKIVIAEDVSDLHPVDELVNINLAVPVDNPVTTPEFVILATEGFTDCQVPPDDGKN